MDLVTILPTHFIRVGHWTIIQIDNPKLRLTVGPLDHSRLSLVNLDSPNYAMWTMEPSSIYRMLDLYYRAYEKRVHVSFCLY